MNDNGRNTEECGLDIGHVRADPIDIGEYGPEMPDRGNTSILEGFCCCKRHDAAAAGRITEGEDAVR